MHPYEGNGSPEDRRLQIAVAGGSIGGLCAGLALHGSGFDVNVYERHPGPMDTRGAGIVVQGFRQGNFQPSDSAFRSKRQNPRRAGKSCGRRGKNRCRRRVADGREISTRERAGANRPYRGGGREAHRRPRCSFARRVAVAGAQKLRLVPLSRAGEAGFPKATLSARRKPLSLRRASNL